MFLYSEVLKDLGYRLGTLDADLLASRYSNNLDRFVSRSKDPLVKAMTLQGQFTLI